LADTRLNFQTRLWLVCNIVQHPSPYVMRVWFNCWCLRFSIIFVDNVNVSAYSWVNRAQECLWICQLGLDMLYT